MNEWENERRKSCGVDLGLRQSRGISKTRRNIKRELPCIFFVPLRFLVCLFLRFTLFLDFDLLFLLPLFEHPGDAVDFPLLTSLESPPPSLVLFASSLIRDLHSDASVNIYPLSFEYILHSHLWPLIISVIY